MRRDEDEDADAAHALPGFGHFSTTAERSAVRGEHARAAAWTAALPRPASWRMSASRTHVEQYESGANLRSYPTAGGAGVGWSNWDESRASPAPGAG